MQYFIVFLWEKVSSRKSTKHQADIRSCNKGWVGYLVLVKYFKKILFLFHFSHLESWPKRLKVNFYCCCNFSPLNVTAISRAQGMDGAPGCPGVRALTLEKHKSTTFYWYLKFTFSFDSFAVKTSHHQYDVTLQAWGGWPTVNK